MTAIRFAATTSVAERFTMTQRQHTRLPNTSDSSILLSRHTGSRGEEHYLDWVVAIWSETGRADHRCGFSNAAAVGTWKETAWAKRKLRSEDYNGLPHKARIILQATRWRESKICSPPVRFMCAGDLYHLSRDTIFKDAAKRIVEPLVESVLDPYHDPAAAAISYYRRTFQDTTFDQPIRSQLIGMPPIPRHLALIFPQEVRRREHGVGRRAEIWRIGVNGRTTVPCSQSGNHQRQP